MTSLRIAAKTGIWRPPKAAHVKHSTILQVQAVKNSFFTYLVLFIICCFHYTFNMNIYAEKAHQRLVKSSVFLICKCMHKHRRCVFCQIQEMQP